MEQVRGNRGLPKLKLLRETVRQFVLNSPNGQENETFSGECSGYSERSGGGCTCSTLDCETYVGCETV